ncbi:uncharacterized protein METZ01_LOCUS245699, partial [marine metagenome]
RTSSNPLSVRNLLWNLQQGVEGCPCISISALNG